MISTNQLRNGFTLVELLISMAVIGVLISFALPLYQDYSARAQASEATQLLGGLKNQIVEFQTNTGICPNTTFPNSDMGNAILTGEYVQTITQNTSIPNGCSYDALFKSQTINSKLRSKIITMTYSTVTKYFTFSCSTIPTEARPNICN